MAPTAPSQAGKFKPRKPAKKITIGGSDAAGAIAVAPDSAPSSLAAPRSDGRNGGRGRRGGSGARDGGRGGRRGMPRAPMPQGQAFFTAQPAAATSGRQRRQSANASTSVDVMARQPQNDAAASATLGGGGLHLQARVAVGTEEEIVGTLECAVGSILPPATVSSGTENTKFNRDTAQTAFERALMGEEDTVSMGGPANGLDGHWYDSDSSKDDEEQRRESKRNADTMSTNTPSMSVQMPLSLPFPPVASTDDRHADESIPQMRENPLLPPFDNSGNPNALQREKDSWFLVQLPTRLPPIQQQDALHPTELKSEKVDDGGHFLAHHQEVAAVATAPMQVNAFDNALTNAVPGRIGTIKVYKSGKTVLVLEGASGTPSVGNETLNGVSSMIIAARVQSQKGLPNETHASPLFHTRAVDDECLGGIELWLSPASGDY
jgi:RNA polymerase III RPC4